MLFEQIGVEWARHLPERGIDRSQAAESAILEALALSEPGELAAYGRRRASELAPYVPNLVERGRAEVLDGGTDAEQIGRVLIAIGFLTAEGMAVGHFLVGHALRREGGARYFEQARLAYRDLGSHALERLCALAAEAAKADPHAEDLSTDGLTSAFGLLSQVDADCARRLAPGVQHYLTMLRVTRELAAGYTPPIEMPPVTDDDLNMLRTAMIVALPQPEQVVRIAQWIQALRGLPVGATEELDLITQLLGEVQDWERRIHLLRYLMTHGDRRSETVLDLTRSLMMVRQFDEAKALLISLIGESPEPRDLELFEAIVRLCYLSGDPDLASWLSKLEALGGSLAAAMKLSPSMLTGDSTPPPQLLAHYENGTLTFDPRLGTEGPDVIRAHMMAAMILGLGEREGVKLRDDIAQKEPEFFTRVVDLLPLFARPRSAGNEYLANAEHLFRQGQYHEAISEYQNAIKADPELAYAHLGLGDTYYRLGRFNLAAAHFTESIAIRPSPQAYRFLGDAILHGERDLQRAEQCYEQALALDPDYRGAQDALAGVRAAQRGM